MGQSFSLYSFVIKSSVWSRLRTPLPLRGVLTGGLRPFADPLFGFLVPYSILVDASAPELPDSISGLPSYMFRVHCRCNAGSDDKLVLTKVQVNELPESKQKQIGPCRASHFTHSDFGTGVPWGVRQCR